jgi:hypothetical protein
VNKCSKYTPKLQFSASIRGLRRGVREGQLARQGIAASGDRT